MYWLPELTGKHQIGKKMTRTQQVALYVAAFNASGKVDFTIRRAQLACYMDRGTRFEDFEPLIARLKAKSDAAWEVAKAETTDHSIIMEACQSPEIITTWAK